MKLERSISFFDLSTDDLVKEIILPETLSLETLKKIITPKEDDYELYDPYRIDSDALFKFREIIPELNASNIDLSKEALYLACFEIT